MSIFISVAAYRDSEVVPTVLDALAKAEDPDDLRFGILWQHGEGDDVSLLRDDRRVEILAVPWRLSQGACWARAEIMSKLYNGEDYFFQIDSHHRFVPGWDRRLLAAFEAAPSEKPILTAYGPAYQREHEPDPESDALQLVFFAFADDGIPQVRPVPIPNWRDLDRRPVRARHASAHLLFAAGSFVDDVPYDPELYFIGEELNLTLRAYTHGYDLFHPAEVLLWHHYVGEYRHKHWDDHGPQPDAGERARIPGTWFRRDRASRVAVRRLMLQPTVGPLTCGSVRTVADYQRYAGIDFRERVIEAASLAGVEPAGLVTPVG